MAVFVSRNESSDRLLVVIDSVGLALGGDANDAQTVLAFFGALNQLETTTLLIDHMGKGPDSQERGAFGSVYKRNSARSLWEMRQATGGDMGLYHRKANNSRLLSAVGLSLEIIEEDDYLVQASFSPCDVADDSELAKGLTAPQRITAALKHGQMSLESICEALGGVPRQTLEPDLSRIVKKGKLIRPKRGMYGLAIQ